GAAAVAVAATVAGTAEPVGSGSGLTASPAETGEAGRGPAAATATEEVLLLAGADAADLLGQLDAWTPGAATLTVPGPDDGPARLAVVEPNDRRLTLARKVLERGTPFRGRNDVWFEPGDDTGIRGGKVAFLFPGVEPVFEPRVDDVAEQLEIAWEGLADDVPPLERQGRGIVQVGLLLDEALARIGVRPDLAAGHSLGEWTGQIVSGQIPTTYVDDFLDSLQPGSIEVSDVVFVALGAGIDVAESLVDGLADAYVSHDNCPHQSVICAPAASMAVAVERAKERKVLAQELPFRSGFHSPLFAPFVASMAEQFSGIPLTVADVPMWSATTVAPYPDDPAGITELSGRHLVEPVRFRELADALYADGVRAFVQVGTGSLLGFVDDTLRDEDILTISANTAKQTGVDQLRRVAAALWSVGHAVDFAPLGHAVATTTPADRTSYASTTESSSSPTKFAASSGGSQPLVLGSTLVRDLTPIDRPVADGPSDADWAELDAPGPLIDEFRGGLADASAAALDVLRAARDSKRSLAAPIARTTPPLRTSHVSAPESSFSPTKFDRGEGVVEPDEAGPSLKETVHHLSVAEQPFWLDHAFYEQPAGWPVVDDLFPLVPMTAIIEMLQHAAEDLVPGTVATRVEAIRAFKWLTVHPPTAVTVRATRDGDGPDPATGETTVKASIDKHARATVVVAEGYPEPPA
ncbi:MAG TPA: acyltransferase domain-containing protein, partial [Acidimicrobiales bacterium]|nr:acyltransferase domain-containing protein [Acidimicrobiales bacterium]